LRRLISGAEKHPHVDLILLYAALLLAAVLVSDLAHRSVLSTAVIFRLGGVFIGGNLFSFQPDDPQVRLITELTLFAVLFTDGMRVDTRELFQTWRLPTRALLVGLPLTMVLTSALAYFVIDLAWPQAMLVGVILSPTDPVLAAAIIGRHEVPLRLRRLLNIESGINDGLALPFVVIFLETAKAEPLDVLAVVSEVFLGIFVGGAIAYAAVLLERLPAFQSHGLYKPLNGFAIGLLILAATSLVHANEFLAAFTGGAVIAAASPDIRRSFQEVGDLIAEALKLLAILIFGSLISLKFLGDVGLAGYTFVFLALVLIRPVTLGIAMFGAKIKLQEFAAAAWFGPKGFSSVVYGLLIVVEGLPDGVHLFHIVAAVVCASIVLHSSTDVVVAQYFAGVEGKTGRRRLQPQQRTRSCNKSGQ
jgi:NhaP-type Na+/H+ or K+/H+ antiporter